MNKPELLAPAKSLKILKVAVRYGANAIYIGGEAFGLRAKADNFSNEEMDEGIKYAHERGVKVYVTANILAHNYDMVGAVKYFKELNELKPDGIIVADPGMFLLAKENCPSIDIHISTQANNTNYETAKFWKMQGAARIVTARELSLYEIKQLHEKVPDIEIETFVHGAMCMSYSGRCLLSSCLVGKDANRGECTHPCRWKYSLVEEKRPGEYFPVYENERGTYIMNSKDLCMINHIDKLVDSGIFSFKIEGRMKTALYVATVVRAYRNAIDDYLKSPELYRKNINHYWDEIKSTTYRPFSTGFFFGKTTNKDQIYDNNTYINGGIYIGIARENDGTYFDMTQKNKFSVGETIEIMKPDGQNIEAKVLEIIGMHGESMSSAPHAKEKIKVKLSIMPEIGDVMRRMEKND